MGRTCRSCLTKSLPRQRKCGACGKPLPKRRRPKHMKALDLPRSAYLTANDGLDGCWVCNELGLPLDKPTVRDHEHVGDGRPRGLLCVWHNRKLGPAYTAPLVAAYAKYLARLEAAA